MSFEKLNIPTENFYNSHFKLSYSNFEEQKEFNITDTVNLIIGMINPKKFLKQKLTKKQYEVKKLITAIDNCVNKF